MKVDCKSVKFLFAILILVENSAAGKGALAASDEAVVQAEARRAYSGQLAARLAAPDPATATRVALALGRIGDPRAAAPLREAVRSARDPSVRAMAVYALGLLTRRIALDPALVAAALADRSSAVRAAGVDAARRAAAAHGDAIRLLRPLARVVRDDPDPIVRARAAAALAAFSTGPRADAAARALAAAARDRDREVRRHAAWAIARGFARRVPRALIAAGLGDPDETVRIAFAGAAGRSGDRTFVAALERLSRDPHWRPAEGAREALRMLRGRPRTAHLTAIPAGVATPPPPPPDRTPALRRTPRPAAVPAMLPLLLRDASALDGPLPGPHPRVRIGTTQGPIVVRLYPEWAPLTVANFLRLVDRGYYDGLRWFRIVPDFVAQTGDRHNDGEGEAGFTVPAEENPLEQRAGVISMALNYQNGAAVRDSAGSQFYLTMSPQLHLDDDFTVFGEIERGFSVLGRLLESDRMTRVERLPPD